MSTTASNEWDDLGAAWRAADEPVDLGPLRRLVATQRRRLVAVVAGEAALVLAFAALSWLVARDGVATWEAVWLATLWSFTAVAVAFAAWNRRGTWAGLGESVEDHLRVARLRARRALAAVSFAIGLLVAEVVAVAVELAWYDRFGATEIALLAAVAGAVAAWCGWTRRRVRRELALLDELEALQRQD